MLLKYFYKQAGGKTQSFVVTQGTVDLTGFIFPMFTAYILFECIHATLKGRCSHRLPKKNHYNILIYNTICLRQTV